MKQLITRLIGAYVNGLALVAPSTAGKLAFELFCRPYRTPLNKKQLDFLNAAAFKTIAFKNTNLQAYRWGTGPKTILLVHGWQSHTYRWKTYIESIDKNEYTVYAFDAPGHGLSEGNFLNLVLYSEAIKNFIGQIGAIDCIVSHSIGSFSSIYMLQQSPDMKVHKVVAMAPPGEVKEFFEFYGATLRLTDRSTSALIAYFKKFLNQSPEYFSAPDFAASLQINGLIIHDEEDAEAPVHHAKRLHHSWKKSRLVITKGLGHNLKSTEVISKVVEFINESPAAQSASTSLLTSHI